MSKRVIEGCYARLQGIKDSTFSNLPALPRAMGEDYIDIVKLLRENSEDDFIGFDLKDHMYLKRMTVSTHMKKSHFYLS